MADLKPEDASEALKVTVPAQNSYYKLLIFYSIGCLAMSSGLQAWLLLRFLLGYFYFDSRRVPFIGLLFTSPPLCRSWLVRAFFIIALVQCHPVSYFGTEISLARAYQLILLFAFSYIYSAISIFTDATFSILL